jgi:hypothetical protein
MSAPLPSSPSRNWSDVRCCCSVTRSWSPHLLHRSLSRLYSSADQSEPSDAEDDTGSTTHESIRVYRTFNLGCRPSPFTLSFNAGLLDRNSSVLRADSPNAVLIFVSTALMSASICHITNQIGPVVARQCGKQTSMFDVAYGDFSWRGGCHSVSITIGGGPA